MREPAIRRADARTSMVPSRRLAVRTRLTLTYTALFTGAGTIMLASIYLFMRFVPTYAIRSAVHLAAPGERRAATAPTDPGLAPDLSVEPSGTALIVLSDQTDIMNLLLIASVVFLVILAGLSAWMGWVLSGRVLQPLQAINRAAQRASGGRLDHRLAMRGPHDEVRDLADTFDEMLGRLERSFQAHQRFAANASHELRTPLATTQAMLDVALQHPGRVSGEDRRLLERLRTMNTRSIQTVEALLDLADLGQGNMATDPVHLAPVLRAAVDLVRQDAELRGLSIVLDLDEGAVADGDLTLLQQAVQNLLCNAVRHNIDRGFISVSLRADRLGAAEIRIENTGPQLDAAVIERLVEPFYRDAGRVATGRHRSRGLGLAIVDSVVAAHRGRLAFEARIAGGLIVTVVLSTASSTERDASAHEAGGPPAEALLPVG